MLATSPRKIAQALLGAIENSSQPGRTMTSFAQWLYQSGLWDKRHRIISAFADEEMNSQGLHKIRVTTARKLSEDEQEAIMKAVRAEQQNVDPKHVLFDWEVDEALLGGIKIAFDGAVIDATLQHRLSILETTIR